MVPMLVNHLWQSTVFAAIVALLTLALKTNHARTRYWLWLASSLKFVIPFSLLVGAGKYLGSLLGQHPAQHTWMLITEDISRPFPPPVLYSMSTQAAHIALYNMRPLLGLIWLSGFAAVLYSWCKRWRRVSAAVRAAQPVREGRELDAMRRLQSAAGVATLVELASSPASLEPGVFGIVRPVLVLPAGISDHLSDAQLEAIFAHELCHVRWRDNLSASIHMAIEAVFWFHPLVWWLGTRLVDERERACDEDVLRLGSEPSVYAESILRTCKFYLESPLACVAGITGSNLKRRIEGIMMHRPALRLDLGRKVLLCAAAAASIVVPVVVGILNAPHAQAQSEASDAPLEFEVASIKPNNSGSHQVSIMRAPGGRFTATNATVKALITMAYDLRDHQISGGPGWIGSEHYDIVAKMEGEPSREQFRRVVQSLLAERFKFASHVETKELPVYALVAGKNGSKLRQSATLDESAPHKSGLKMERGSLEGFTASMSMLARGLSDLTGRTVVDRTGLPGAFDFRLNWTPDDSERKPPLDGDAESTANETSLGPSIFTAVKEQLGLKLEAANGPVEILVIDHIEKASAN